MRRVLLTVALITMVMTRLTAQPLTPDEDPTVRMLREQREKSDLEYRLRHAEDAGYEYRAPTPSEIEALQKKWLADNPLVFSGRMPDFSKQRIRVRKSDPQAAETQAATAALAERLSALEQQAKQPMAAPVQHQPITIKKAVAPPRHEQPAIPNPASVVLRKLPDGRVSAIIGDKLLTFKNATEAQAYIEKTKLSAIKP